MENKKSAGLNSEKEETKEGLPFWYYITPLIMLLFAGPYVYYSLLINKAAKENPRQGYRFPMITDFWMSAVFGATTLFLKYTVPPLF